jgi:hypothetical protein
VRQRREVELQPAVDPHSGIGAFDLPVIVS